MFLRVIPVLNRFECTRMWNR